LNVEEKILKNKEVCNVDWSRSADEFVTVKCSDGTDYIAEHVVVSVPLGVLKHNYTTMFTPQLPNVKKNAIEGISFGTVGKIYLEFDEPWWPKDWFGLSLLWTKADVEEIKSTENYWQVIAINILSEASIKFFSSFSSPGWSQFSASIP
jgi:spermine oxidase